MSSSGAVFDLNSGYEGYEGQNGQKELDEKLAAALEARKARKRIEAEAYYEAFGEVIDEEAEKEVEKEYRRLKARQAAQKRLTQEEHRAFGMGQYDPETGEATLATTSASDLMQMADEPLSWLVRAVLQAATYGPVGGPKKALKSWLVLTLAVALASGKKWLGMFDVGEPRNVLLMAGESQKPRLSKNLAAVTRMMGVKWDELETTINFSTAVHVMGSDDWFKALEADLLDVDYGLVIVDPLYTYHPAELSTSQMHARANALMRSTKTIRDRGITILIVDHWREHNLTDDVLDNLTGAGMGAFADSWMASSHLVKPDPENEYYFTKLEIGGRHQTRMILQIEWWIAQWNDDGSIAREMSVKAEIYDPSRWEKGKDKADTVASRLWEVFITAERANYPARLTREFLKSSVKGKHKDIIDELDGLISQGLVVPVSYERENSAGAVRTFECYEVAEKIEPIKAGESGHAPDGHAPEVGE